MVHVFRFKFLFSVFVSGSKGLPVRLWFVGEHEPLLLVDVMNPTAPFAFRTAFSLLAVSGFVSCFAFSTKQSFSTLAVRCKPLAL